MRLPRQYAVIYTLTLSSITYNTMTNSYPCCQTQPACLVYLVLMMYSSECMAIHLILITIITINSYLHYQTLTLRSTGWYSDKHLQVYEFLTSVINAIRIAKTVIIKV